MGPGCATSTLAYFVIMHAAGAIFVAGEMGELCTRLLADAGGLKLYGQHGALACGPLVCVQHRKRVFQFQLKLHTLCY